MRTSKQRHTYNKRKIHRTQTKVLSWVISLQSIMSLILHLLQGKSKSQWWIVNSSRDSQFSPQTSWDLFVASAAKFAAAQLDLPLTFVLAVLLPWPELEQGIAYIWGWWLLGASPYGLEPRLVTWPSPLRHVKLALPVKAKQLTENQVAPYLTLGIVLIRGRKRTDKNIISCL
jgi:hypothetical protein